MAGAGIYAQVQVLSFVGVKEEPEHHFLHRLRAVLHGGGGSGLKGLNGELSK